MTLRVRVALLVAAVVAVAVAAVCWAAVRSARAELTEEVDIDLMARAGLLSDEPRRDFFSQVLGLTSQDRRIGPLLRADPLGSLVSLDAHARVVVVDIGPGLEGVVHGEVILTLDDGIGTVPDARRLERARHRDGPMLETVSVGGIRLRLMTVEASDGVFVQVARPLAEVDSAVEDLRQRALLFGFLAVAAAAAGAWFLAGRAVRPIVRLTRTVEDMRRDR